MLSPYGIPLAECEDCGNTYTICELQDDSGSMVCEYCLSGMDNPDNDPEMSDDEGYGDD